jgi:hypothetical protein
VVDGGDVLLPVKDTSPPIDSCFIDYGVVPGESYATGSVYHLSGARSASGLRCPIYNCVYEGLGLTDCFYSGRANADRNRFALTYGPFPTTRETHFDDREFDGAMFHGRPPLTFKYVLIDATAFVSAGLA